jgi:hypothetical protein
VRQLFELGVYGGGGYHHNWLRDPQVNPGFSPVVGGHATFWTNPNFGVRANVTYNAIELPEGAPIDVNGWFYDLNLVLRPWFTTTGTPNLLSSTYLFLGGGAFTANPPGKDPGCVQPYQTRDGACLALDWRKSTVGQGTAGIGCGPGQPRREHRPLRRARR